MLGVFLETGLFARQFLQMPFRTFGATLLQALTQGMHTLSILLDNFTAEGLAFAIGSKVDDTQVNSEGSRGFIGRRGRNIKGDCQVECPVAVEQISLPFDALYTSLLIASHTEGNKHAPLDSQQRDGHESLKRHHPFVIDDSPFRFKGRLNALISLVCFTGFADGPNSQLSGKFVRSTQLTIDQLLQFK